MGEKPAPSTKKRPRRSATTGAASSRSDVSTPIVRVFVCMNLASLVPPKLESRIPRIKRSLPRQKPPVARRGLDRALQLLEGAHLDLAHPFARDVVALREVLERRRHVAQAPLDEDVALARRQVRHRAPQEVAAEA